MELFQAESPGGELRGQPVEQFRVCRAGSEQSKIGRGFDNPSTEVMHPEAVDQDAPQQGVSP